jgi:hypothetical protein
VHERNSAVRTMIRQLQNAFNETLDALYDLPEDHLQEGCGHSCARGGSARDLLVHNIFHEKQHTGQVWNIRDELRLLQGWGNASLYPLLVDYYLSRAQLTSSLFGLTDEQPGEQISAASDSGYRRDKDGLGPNSFDGSPPPERLFEPLSIHP